MLFTFMISFDTIISSDAKGTKDLEVPKRMLMLRG